jgi:hypothetical protein
MDGKINVAGGNMMRLATGIMADVNRHDAG